MKKILSLILLTLFTFNVSGQFIPPAAGPQSIMKDNSGNLIESFDIPNGVTISFESGSVLTLPDGFIDWAKLTGTDNVTITGGSITGTDIGANNTFTGNILTDPSGTTILIGDSSNGQHGINIIATNTGTVPLAGSAGLLYLYGETQLNLNAAGVGSVVMNTGLVTHFVADSTGFGIRSTLFFEGSTADGNETSIIVTDPTADRSLTIPDADVDLAIDGTGTFLPIAVFQANGQYNMETANDGFIWQGSSTDGDVVFSSEDVTSTNNGRKIRFLTAANVLGTGNGGDFEITTGAGSGGGTDGKIILDSDGGNQDEVEITDSEVTSKVQILIDGSGDTNQLIVQANATQTNTIFVVEQSDGTDLFTVGNNGHITAASADGTTDNDIANVGTLDDRYIRKVTAIKSSDTSRNTTTTLADDPDLDISIPTTGFYRIKLYAVFDYGTTEQAKLALNYSGTVNASNDGDTPAQLYGGNGSLTPIARVDFTSGITDTITVDQGAFGQVIWDTVVEFTTTGDLTLQWAQNISGATNTTLRAGSYLMVEEW